MTHSRELSRKKKKKNKDSPTQNCQIFKNRIEQKQKKNIENIVNIDLSKSCISCVRIINYIVYLCMAHTEKKTFRIGFGHKRRRQRRRSIHLTILYFICAWLMCVCMHVCVLAMDVCVRARDISTESARYNGQALCIVSVSFETSK